MVYIIHEQVGMNGVEKYALHLDGGMEEDYNQNPNKYKKLLIQPVGEHGYWEFIHDKKKGPFQVSYPLGYPHE